MDKKPLKFIHITKCGGTSIEHAGIQQNIQWGRNHKEYRVPNSTEKAPWHRIFPNIDPTIVGNYDWFMVVRNPYDRILSEYYCDHGGIGMLSVEYTKEEMNQYLVNRIQNRSKSGNHYTEQYKYLHPTTKIHIIKFENMRVEFQTLMDKYNIQGIHLENLNAKNKQKYNETRFTTDDFSKELIDIINNVYNKDFESFLYTKKMRIILKDCKMFYLTNNNPVRKKHFEEEFKEYNAIETNPVQSETSKNKSGATGFCKILDQAALAQDRSKPFQPFIILEDDVKKHRKFPIFLDVPEDADIVYIGISNWGIKSHVKGFQNEVCYKIIHQDLVQVYNMLSTHGLIVCSTYGLLLFQKCIMEAYFTNITWDIPLAQAQTYMKAYALKNPLVYQYAKIGGVEHSTKFSMHCEKDKDIDISWINTTNISNATATRPFVTIVN